MRQLNAPIKNDMQMPQKQSATNSVDKPLLMLALLISSYFYVLPFGRFSFGGFLSDFRLYDAMFVLFMLTVGLGHLKYLKTYWRDSSGFFRWSIFLLFLVWMSIGTSYFISFDYSYVLPTLIRAFRFSAYLLTAGYVLAFVKYPSHQRFILYVMFGNIVLQAVLGFAQGVGALPSFWPDYWLDNYGFRPVGTLSPHHKQMGVVMMLGIGLCIGWLSRTRYILSKVIILIILALMVSVPLFAGSRTAWLGFAGMLVGGALVFRARAVLNGVIIAVFLVGAADVAGSTVLDVINEAIESRFTDRIDRFGFEGIAGDRLPIYDSFFRNITDHPHVLIIGAGFQNVDLVVAGTGAHNNYLQVLIELGAPGLWVFMVLLLKIWQGLRRVSKQFPRGSLPRSISDGTSMAFIGILATMFVGETLWAQYSMFTLTGQIMTLIAVAIAPLYWENCQSSNSV